jgi:tRNA A37 N6-isopentenylltransferase MiaA
MGVCSSQTGDQGRHREEREDVAIHAAGASRDPNSYARCACNDINRLVRSLGRFHASYITRRGVDEGSIDVPGKQ